MLKIDKVAKVALYENGIVNFLPKMEIHLVQSFKSKDKAFVN